MDVAFDMSYPYLDFELESASEEAENHYVQALFEKVNDIFLDSGAEFEAIRTILNVEKRLICRSLLIGKGNMTCKI